MVTVILTIVTCAESSGESGFASLEHRKSATFRVLALLVCEHHLEPTPCLLDLLVEHRIEDRVDHLLDILEEERLAKSHRVLELAAELLSVSCEMRASASPRDGVSSRGPGLADHRAAAIARNESP